jgi:hypothetical protein
MELIGGPETSVLSQFTQRNNPEDGRSYSDFFSVFFKWFIWLRKRLSGSCDS